MFHLTPLLADAAAAASAAATTGFFAMIFGTWCCFCGFYGFVILLALASTAMWIWMLIDCVTHEPSEGNDKITWVLVIVLAQGIGALIYYFARRPERKRKFGK